MRPSVGPPTLSRRTRILLVVAGVLVLLLLGGSRLINLYVNWLWFGEVGFRQVFSTPLFTRVVQFIIGGLLVGGLVALSLWIAYRARPVFVPVSGPEDPIARYRTVIIQRLRVFGIGIPLGVGLIAGFAALSDWQTVQLFLNSTPFGTTDPVFNLDVSFYAFQLPFYRYLLDWLFVSVAISFVAALITHYIFGGIRLSGRAGQVPGAARAQLAIIAGVFVLLKAVAYFLDRFELLFSDRNDLFNGATYTDLNAYMPAKLILLAISLFCAVAFFTAVFRRNLQIPAIATVLLVLSSVLIGSAWPAILQQFVVAPNANEREAVSIQRNIDATREAFGLTAAKVAEVPYPSTATLPSAAQVGSDPVTVPNIRLLDPAKLSDTFNQRAQPSKIYGFPPKLDIDRYSVDGKMQDFIVAVRELNTGGLSGNETDWINKHLVYTHGNGLVVAPANQVDGTLGAEGGAGGLPKFTSVDVANKGTTVPDSLKIAEPRAYYGELITDYSIVGGRPGASALEYDFPDQPRNTYTGKGGVPIGSLLNRTVFALHYGERNILFNSSITDDSKIMYVRDPADRVKLVAPWLTTDGDPYPAVVDGRLQWIIDGYTTLDNYPYAQQVPLGQTTADALQPQQVQQRPELNRNISYLRNSVKATVDAYDGTVTLYEFDVKDPVLKTWEKVFPGTVKPASDISPSLRSHFRYPEDQFKVQRDLITRYHVDNPIEFYGNVSFWGVPSDPTVGGGGGTTAANQPPYYILAAPPDGKSNATASFQLTSALVYRGREILSAVISASSDPETYGQITVLQVPQEAQRRGPQQVQTAFIGSPELVSDIGLLNRSGLSSILYGNLLTLPLMNGLLYVEPVYIERSGQDSSYPQLARVLLMYGESVGYGSSMSAALEDLFGKGAAAGLVGAPPPVAGTTPPPAGTNPPATGTLTPDLAAAAGDISRAFTQLKAAQVSGDFAAQGTALAALDAAVNRFQTLQGAAGTPPR